MKEILENRHRAEREARENTIVSAARKLFLEKGYHNTTMRDICDAAKLSTGAVYFYFGGKDDIYTRICEESFHVLLEMLSENIHKVTSARERLTSLKDAYLRFYVEQHDRWVMLSSGFRNVNLSTQLQEKLEKLHSSALELVHKTVDSLLQEHRISPGMSTQEITFGLWASVEGLLILHDQKYFEDMSTSLSEMVDKQMAVFLKGLGI